MERAKYHPPLIARALKLAPWAVVRYETDRPGNGPEGYFFVGVHKWCESLHTADLLRLDAAQRGRPDKEYYEVRLAPFIAIPKYRIDWKVQWHRTRHSRMYFDVCTTPSDPLSFRWRSLQPVLSPK